MNNRKPFWLNDNRSDVSTPSTREQMYGRISKIPFQKLYEIVCEYRLARFPDVLNERTLANLICDCTIERVANEIMNGDDQ